MIPGEYLIDEGEHALNPGRTALTLVVQNTANRPVQVGSHYHFAETNAALRFDRAAAQGMRTLRDDGVSKALAGMTTFDEVLRVTQDDVISID